jgi:hypothetical protein
MLTGTDISIRECRASGYPVVEHRDKKMNPRKDYWLTISDPSKWTFDGAPYPMAEDRYLFAGMVSYQELWDYFNEQGQGIKDYCDFANCPYPSPDEEPTHMDLASLAGTLFSYCGLE